MDVARADDCGESTRVNKPNCVSTYAGHSKHMYAYNWCFNAVKIKVDRRGTFCKDWTWHLEHHGTENDTGSCTVHSVKCCGSASNSDCDQSWATNCAAAFRASQAANSCTSVLATRPESTDKCSISARCLDDHSISFHHTSIDVDEGEADDVLNCNGKLSIDPCS